MKDNSILHRILDLVLETQNTSNPKVDISMNVTTLGYSTTGIWFFDIQEDGKIGETKCHYDRFGDGWEKWENGNVTYGVTDEEVLEALRNV